MTQLRRAVAVWLAALLFVTGLAAAPAGASDPDVGIDSVDEVEEAVEDVLAEVPVIEDLVEDTLADVQDLEIDENADVVVELEAADGSSVEIPDEADEPIVLEDADGDTLEVELPGNADDAEVTDDGSVVYEDAVTDTDIVVQAQEDGGVRILAVLDGAGAPSAFDFDLAGASDLVELPDGSVFVIDHDGEPLAEVPPAWAYDADGREVPSWYSVQGDTLRLHVDHSATSAYPVVADPKLKRSWYGLLTLKLNRSETRNLSSLLSSGSHASAIGAAVCAGLSGGVCSAPWAIGWAVLGVGRIAIDTCSNSKGVDLHWYPGPVLVMWCSGY